MKVFGIGNDVVPIARFTRLVNENESIVLQRMFTEDEAHSISQLKVLEKRVQAIASSFAVKESVVKALGTGLALGMSWKDIEVHDLWGTCQLNVYGKVDDYFQDSNITEWRVSSSATSELAIAFVILFSKE